VASARVRAVRAGAGARETLDADGRGRVVAWFPKACYLQGPGGLLAAVGPAVHDGPVHLVLDRGLSRVEPGAAVVFSEGHVELPGCTIATEGAQAWVGALPDAGSVRAAADTIVEVAAATARGTLLPPRGAAARGLVERGELEAAAAMLAGLGPGLTPSGDDVIGGVLFARRILAGPAEGPRLGTIAESMRTNAIARAFLRWAARGQALSPVHGLLQAATTGDLAAARAAGRALGTVGESSGADFALGLAWAIAADRSDAA
jgi:hypothetical protein